MEFGDLWQALVAFSCLVPVALFSMEISREKHLLPNKAGAKAIIAAIEAQKHKEKQKNYTREDEDKENRPPQESSREARTEELQNIYTRNYPKLAVLLAQQHPKQAQALLQEAQRLTPYLSTVHYQQYPTRAQQPEAVSPLSSTEKHSKKRKIKLPLQDITAVRRLFAPREEWSFQGRAPYGYSVQQRDELVDPFQADEEGVINLEHMLQGNAPYGPDSTRVNLHHWLRQDPGPLAELSGTFHRREAGPLHGVDSSGIRDRIPFDQFRRLYWEGRAYDILESLNLTP